MPRPYKENAEYFSHDADASSDEKIIYLESKHGFTGYAFYFKMLEILARSKNFEIKLNEVSSAIYAKKIGVSLQEFSAIIQDCVRPEIHAFVLVDGKLYSEGLKKRLKSLVEKRERQRKSIPESTEQIPIEQNSSTITTKTTGSNIIVSGNSVIDADNPVIISNQTTKTHIVKESKVKKSKQEKINHDDDDSLNSFHEVVNSESGNNSSKHDVSKLFSVWSRAPDSLAEKNIAVDLLKSFPFSKVKEAFYLAAEHGKYNLAYVRAILNNNCKNKSENKLGNSTPPDGHSGYIQREADKDFSSVIIQSNGPSS